MKSSATVVLATAVAHVAVRAANDAPDPEENCSLRERKLIVKSGRCLLGRSSVNGRISLSRTPVSQKVAKIVNVIISTAHFEKRLNSLPRRSDGLDQQILEPRARVELAACRLRNGALPL